MTSANNKEVQQRAHVLTCIFCKRPKVAGVADGPDALEATRTETKPDGTSKTEKFWVCSTCCSDTSSDCDQETTDALVAYAKAATIKDTSSFRTNGSNETTGEKKQECACQACIERRDMELEQQRELSSLRKCWLQLRHSIRQMYRDGLHSNMCTSKNKQFDEARLKYLIHQLCERDAHQLYQKLESQGREFVMDMKVNLLEILVSPEKCGIENGDSVDQRASATGITLEQTKFFLKSTLDSFSAFQETVRNMQPFIGELDRVHLEKFGITWKVVNHHLFDSIVYQDSLIQSALPAMAEKLGLDLVLPDTSEPSGRASPGGTKLDEHGEPRQLPLAAVELAQSFRALHRLMRTSREIWEKANKRMEEYAEKQVKLYKETLRAKQRMLKEDLEFFKQQRRLLEKYVAKRSTGGDIQTSSDEDLAAFTETLRQLLTGAGRPNRSHAASPVRCQRCQQRHCPCDECTISHVITCGLLSEGEAPPTHVTQQELNEFEFPPSLLEELPALDICDFKLDMLTCGLSPDDYILDNDDALTSTDDDSQDSTDSLTDTSEDDDDYEHIDSLTSKRKTHNAPTTDMAKSKDVNSGGIVKTKNKDNRFSLPRKLYTLHDEHERKHGCQSTTANNLATAGDPPKALMVTKTGSDDQRHSLLSSASSKISDADLAKAASMKRHMQHAYGDWEISNDPTSRLFSALPFEVRKAAAAAIDFEPSDATKNATTAKRSIGDGKSTAAAASALHASLTVTCDFNDAGGRAATVKINPKAGDVKCTAVGGKNSSADPPALPPPRNKPLKVWRLDVQSETPLKLRLRVFRMLLPDSCTSTRPQGTSSSSSRSSSSTQSKSIPSNLGGGSLIDAATFPAFNLAEVYCESAKKPPLDKAEFIKLLKQQSQAHKRDAAAGKVPASGSSKSMIKANADGVTIEVTKTTHKHYTLDEFCNVNYKDVAASPEVMRRVYENLREAAANMDKAVESGFFPADAFAKDAKVAFNPDKILLNPTDAFPHVQVGAESKPAAALNKTWCDTNSVAIQVATAELPIPKPNKIIGAPAPDGDDMGMGGHHCDCCYCEMFGDGTGFDRGFSCRRDDVRERLRQKLKRKGEEHPDAKHQEHTVPTAQAATVANTVTVKTAEMIEGYKGHEPLDDVLAYIEGRDKSTESQQRDQSKENNSTSKAAKRQRQRQRKLQQQQALLKEKLLDHNTNQYENNCSDKHNNSNNNGTHTSGSKKAKSADPSASADNTENQKLRRSLSTVKNDKHALLHEPISVEDVFTPRTDSLDQLDEDDRDVEMFKQFVLDCEPQQNRVKVNLDLSNLRRHCGSRLQRVAQSAQGTAV